ncbi:MAG: SpaH/EbpB family LPXTG-anchored major pilin [Clostridiales bacterium]|nr:SpaH/EbpB family LPXTG-anchored major pilin [Clostridiales bacterium]
MDQMKEGNKEMKENMEVIMKQRGLRKLVSMILAVVIVFAMSSTAFAATITIENTTTDKTYTAYKIFDATVDSDDSTNVSYTIDSGSVWYSTISAATDVFTLVQAGENSTTYYVIKKDNVTDAQVLAVFASVPDGATEAATNTGNGRQLTLNVEDAGYYYITTNSGAGVTITTTTGTITVYDKTQTPGSELEKTANDTKAQIGDTVTYTITSNVPTYEGETPIEKYTFTDTLSEGLDAPDESKVTVKIKNGDGNEIDTGNAIEISVSGQTITITYELADITNYPADATIEISYTATVNAKAGYANGNEVSHTWNENSTGETDTETVYTYGFNLQKVDGSNSTIQLSGAKFKLYTNATGGTAISFTKTVNGDDVIYTVDPEGTETEIEVGYATIKGLDADVTYYLEETQAPDGYNMVGGRTAVTVGQSETTGEGDEAVTTYSYNTETGINTSKTTIENNAGSSLPSTGGIGTTIFYIVGGVLVLGAAVLFVTKRRLSNEN